MITAEAPDDTVSKYLSRQHVMLIGGKWTAAQSGRTLDVRNPATGTVIASVPAGDANDINLAVRAAREAFEDNRWMKVGPNERSKILWRIGDLIDKHIEELSELETLNNGMPVKDAKLASLPRAAATFRYYAGAASRIHGKTSEIVSGPTSILGYTLREPIGVAGLIIPWNSPLMMAAWKLAPALAAGCCCVLKPAEETPLTALRLGELMLEAGIPNGVVNIVTGLGSEAGAALTAHNDVDKIAFTGSTETGKAILQAATGNLKKVSLELGGKSPVIVFDDANIEDAVTGAARAIFGNAGQICSAGSRLYVQKGAYKGVLDGVARQADKLKVGPGLQPTTDMGPLVSGVQQSRVLEYIRSGVAEGAEIVTGGQVIGNEGYFVQPTVLSKTHSDMKVVREEIFGPVLAVMSFDSIDEIPSVANNTPYGLAASVWTNDIATAHLLARRIKAGSIGINTHSLLDQSMPFGGYKSSGWGRENSSEAVDAYLETKSVFVKM